MRPDFFKIQRWPCSRNYTGRGYFTGFDAGLYE